jgi:hypothetical protein
MFLGLLDADPLVGGKDPDPGPSINQAKIVKTPTSTVL